MLSIPGAWSESMVFITGYTENNIIAGTILAEVEHQVLKVVRVLRDFVDCNGRLVRRQPRGAECCETAGVWSECDTIFEGFVVKYSLASETLMAMIINTRGLRSC